MCTVFSPCQINKPLVQNFFDVAKRIWSKSRQQRKNKGLRHNFSKHLAMVEVPSLLDYSVIRRMCLLIVDSQQHLVENEYHDLPLVLWFLDMYSGVKRKRCGCCPSCLRDYRPMSLLPGQDKVWR